VICWSNRVEADRTANRLTRAVAGLRSQGRSIIDLTASNPTVAGFQYPPTLLRDLAAPPALVYAPDAFGAWPSRQTVADEYGRRGVRVTPDRIVLTASTSEAYSLLFKVLCDPHTEVLVPRPSYPLLDHLTRLDALTPRPYALEYHGRWSIDFDSIARAISTATRAVIVVSPNNPTGSCITRDELARLSALCRRHQLALIVDEVFADYALADPPGPGGLPLTVDDALTFSLGGLSKSVGLPQVKLAWIAAAGPAASVAEALSRLEVAADAYLSVSTPVQTAAADLLDRGAAVRDQIRARVVANYRQLRELAADSEVSVLHADAGWYAVLRVPSLAPEEDLVVDLLLSECVLTHPGYFFDFASEAYVIVSLLPQTAVFRDGIERLARHFACRMDRA
jgi:aspartate/methionine/tyrosine aminotransferase